MLNVVIMCGGNGTRLWPLSREKLPKQFLKLVNEDYTMFQLTCLRAKLLSFNKLIVICNSQHTFIAKQQLEDLEIYNYRIVGEPFGRNTAAAVATSSLLSNEDTNLLVMSSDHVWNDSKFCLSVEEGLNYASNYIVTFGVKPTYAETGFGYINYSGNNLLKFVEKPNKETAEEYLLDGGYLWNSGNFIFNNKILKEEFEKHAKDIYDAVKLTLDNSKSINNEINLCKEYFEKVRDESIDYAVMEHLENAKIVIYNDKWKDIGSFKSLYDELPKNLNGNVLSGDIKCIDTENCYIKSENKLVTALGIENLVVVDTRDTLFIADKERSQDVKLFVKELKKEERQETVVHAKAYRPWGWYINIDGNDNSGSKVKRIGVYPSKRLSLQSHNKRSEHWVIVKGQAKVQVGEDFHILHKNQSIYIPVGVLHRMENKGDEMVEFIETQIGDYLGEDDIVRYQDDFGRV